MAKGRLSFQPFPGAGLGRGLCQGPQEGRAISRGVWNCVPRGGTAPGVGEVVRHCVWLEPAGTRGLVSLWARLEPVGTFSPSREHQGAGSPR